MVQEIYSAGCASLSLQTKYCVSPDGVASEGEHMRMVSSNYSQCIMDAGHETCPADGSVHFHSFMQSLLGLAVMVSVVNTSSWQWHQYFQLAVRLIKTQWDEIHKYKFLFLGPCVNCSIILLHAKYAFNIFEKLKIPLLLSVK